MQIRSESAILVISEIDLEPTPFRLDLHIQGDAPVRVLTLSRESDAPERQRLLQDFNQQLQILFEGNELGQDVKLGIGGFVDELNEKPSSDKHRTP